jgi:ribosomal protein S18 acetylase RimI-like enzyme
MTMNIRPLSPPDAQQVARLHIDGIGTGFISSLGDEFVTKLYRAIAMSEFGFGLVAEYDGQILAFVAFTSDLSGLYKSVLRYGGIGLIWLLLRRTLSLQRIKRVFQNVFYPSKTVKQDLPRAELLSVVVANEARGRGLATELVKKGLQECARRGIHNVKVLVAADNEPANKLYRRCGFEIASRVDSHGTPSNVYVCNTTQMNDASDT